MKRCFLLLTVALCLCCANRLSAQTFKFTDNSGPTGCSNGVTTCVTVNGISVSAGDFAVVAVSRGTDVTCPQNGDTMTDTAGLFTFSSAVICESNASLGITEIFISSGTATGSNANDKFTWGAGAGKNGPHVLALTYSGSSIPASPLDQAVGAGTNPASLTVTSPAFTTTSVKELIIQCALGHDNTANWSAGPIGVGSGTLRGIAHGGTGFYTIGCQDLAVTSTQTGITASMTADAAVDDTKFMNAVITLKVTADHTGGQLVSGPLLPQVTPSAAYPPDAGYILTPVASGANLQTAITAAACGTKLNLAHDGTFTSGATPYTLPNKSCTCHTDPTKYIIIQSDTFEANYTAGVRTDPSIQYHAVYAHISGSDTNYGFTANTNGASCWGFAGVDITDTFDGANAVLSLGDGSVTVANYPHDFAVWGSYIHGQSTKGLSRCIMTNANWTAIVDSYLSDCHKIGQDSQAIVMWDSLGPLLAQNSYLQGAGENILIGGSDPRPGVIPSDFTFKQNHFFKPLSWRLGDPSYAGIHWSIKNCFETKDAQRVLIQANVFENGWQDGQVGNCITWNSANQNGNDPQAVIADYTMYYNVIRHYAEVYQISGNTNPTYWSDQRLTIHDNLSWDIDSCKWANCYSGYSPDVTLGGINPGTLYAPFDLWINHETIASNPATQSYGINFTPSGSTPYYGFQTTNSIIDRSQFGAFGRTLGAGDAIMPSLTPGGKANNNCIYGPDAGDTFNNAIFNGKQLITTGQSGVFVNPGADFHVAPTSLCHNAASDGTDMGANIDAVNTATTGVVQTLANIHTVTNVSPSTFTNLGGTSITITGTNFISGEAQVIIGGAGPAVTISTDNCAVNTCTVVTSAPITLAVNDTVNMQGMSAGQSDTGQFTVASVIDTTHFTYTDNGVGTRNWSGGTANRVTPGNLCTSLSVTNSTTITCTTPAATGTVTNGPVSVFECQFGICAQFNGANYN